MSLKVAQVTLVQHSQISAPMVYVTVVIMVCARVRMLSAAAAAVWSVYCWYPVYCPGHLVDMVLGS